VVRDAAGRARALSRPAYLLKVLRGPNARQQKRLCLERAVIGSGEGAHFQLTDPTVSAMHCELLVDETGIRVRDLGAKNGVLVDGRRSRETWLQPVDELTVGGSVIRFQVLDEAEEEVLDAETSMGRLWGRSIRMRQLFADLRRAARSDANLLLLGETGTGKELAAEAVVAESARARMPLVILDCAGLQSSLAESALFGHEKGAFTGAVASQPGIFERARDGTVFLDEVGELPLDLQPKLLGALERRSIQRLGGRAPIALQARVIAATRRDLAVDVNRGVFRADLYYRLSGLEIRLPPLRDHAEDIPELIARCLKELPGSPRLTPDVLHRLGGGDYPGNVRQLLHAVEGAALGLESAPAPSRQATIDLTLPFRIQKDRFVASFERDYLMTLMEATQGKISEAARTSGISRVHLYQLLRKAGLE